MEVAWRSKDPAVRRQAVRTAGRRDERMLLPMMERMLTAETDGYVRMNLGRLVRRPIAAPRTDTPATPEHLPVQVGGGR